MKVTIFAPLVVVFLLSWPTIVVTWIEGNRSNSERRKAVLDQFWFSLMIFLFLIYPTVSLTAVKGLHCREISGKMLLVADMEQSCPYEDPNSISFILSVIGIALYPCKSLCPLFCNF